MAPSTTILDLAPEPVSDPTERPRADESSLTENERTAIAFVEEHSAPDVYIDGESDTLWFPWMGSIELKPMRMEKITGLFVVGLRSKVAASLGKHRHRGSVSAATMSGAWGYKEYNWVCRPGDWVCENPGTIHTLSVEDNTDILFTITGSIEFLNDDDSLKSTLDVFSLGQMYYDHCNAKGIKPNARLWH